MKQKRRPTREQRKLMEQWKLNSSDWFVVKDTPEQMQIVNRWSDTTVKVIPKR